jgi:CRP-like cAMP-binding protein
MSISVHGVRQRTDSDARNWYLVVPQEGLMTSVYRNRILRSFPAREGRLLAGHLRPVYLPKDTVLYEAGQRIKDVYFPEEAVVSYLSGTSEGETIEICVVGNEGVVGIGSLMEDFTEFRAVVQIPGAAYAVSVDFLRREFDQCDVIHRILMRYTKGLLVQLGQTAVCNKFHTVEERLCRWLLMANDKALSPSIPMTQDALARVLGTRRASVSGAAGAFQRKGTIRYTRGTISILNRKVLESAVCECYETISAAHKKS